MLLGGGSADFPDLLVHVFSCCYTWHRCFLLQEERTALGINQSSMFDDDSDEEVGKVSQLSITLVYQTRPICFTKS